LKCMTKNKPALMFATASNPLEVIVVEVHDEGETAVQVPDFTSRRIAGKESLTLTAGVSLGPRFETLMEKVFSCPGMTPPPNTVLMTNDRIC